jgi:hypothetical protein
MADMTQLMGELVGGGMQKQITTLLQLLDQRVDEHRRLNGILVSLKTGNRKLNDIEIMADGSVIDKKEDQAGELIRQQQRSIDNINTILKGFKDGSLTPDQVHVLVDGDIRIMAEEPPEPTSLPIDDEEVIGDDLLLATSGKRNQRK